jgi:hypothetical protein
MSEPLRLLEEIDSFAAIAWLDSQPPAAAADAYFELMRHLYWEKKDTASCVAIARAGVQHCLIAARQCEARDAKLAERLRGTAKGLCYDVASFTWLGWDEPGIQIGSTDTAIGLDAAKANLRMAVELKRGGLPMARAYWVLGAQQLAAGDRAAAKASFVKSVTLARSAQEERDARLSDGYVALTELLEGSPGAAERFEAAKKSAGELEEGAGAVQQLETARRVFERKPPAGSA